jgi:hypothetical protein
MAVAPFDEDPSSCGVVFGDGAGNLYLETEYSVSNEKRDLIRRVGLFVTLNAGFTAYTHQMAPEGSLIAFTPDGKELSSTPMHGYMSTGGVQAGGGIIGVEADCLVTNTIRVDFIDADGALTRSIELADQGCLTYRRSVYLAALVDADGRLLIATDGDSLGSGAIPSGHAGVRWFDSRGQPLTDWFDLGPDVSPDVGPAEPGFLALIGGGVAVDNGAQWFASIPSGEAMVSPPPRGFHGRMVPALGGKAYARIGNGVIDIVDPSSGATCGSLTTPPGYVSVGGDGSLLYMDPEGRDRTTGLCTITVYPNVLR